MKAFKIAEMKSQDLTTKLAKADHAKKSIESVLNVVERQAESQRLILRQIENQLAIAKEQITALGKKLEEAEKAKEQAEQEGYDIGVAETEDALRAEVVGVCRHYCLQVWNEALDQAGVEASFSLRKAENVYYPPTLCTSIPPSSKASLVTSEAKKGQASPSKALSSSHTSPQEAVQAEDLEKAVDTNKEKTQDATQLLVAPNDPSKEKEAPKNMEIVLATLPIPPKEDPKGKGPASTTAAFTQPPKNPKDKLIIKMKSQIDCVFVCSFFYFYFYFTVVLDLFCNLSAFLEAQY